MNKVLLFTIILALGLIGGLGMPEFAHAAVSSDVVSAQCFGQPLIYTFPEDGESTGFQPIPFILPNCHPIAPEPGTPRIFEALLLTEPESGAISDILVEDTFAQTCGSSQACFASDSDSNDLSSLVTELKSNGAVIIGSIPETGGPQDVSTYFGLPPGDVSVQSDVEPNPQIPEFPIPFSMIIIFVSVAAVYVAIRQKMIPGFKSF